MVNRNKSKPFVCAILACLILSLSHQPGIGQLANDRIDTTAYFEFYSNFWINIHHFLYRTIEINKESSLREIMTHPEFAELEPEDKTSLEHAFSYYRENLLEKNLLFNRDLFLLKRWLTTFSPHDTLPADEVDSALVEVLNNTKPVYQKFFWPKHDQQNQRMFREQRDLLREMEPQTMQELSSLCQAKWPSEKIRVDLSFYANWAGAYTTNRPVTHIVISTIGSDVAGDWLETLFHEAAHALIGRNRGVIADAIAQVCEEFQQKPPGLLWHAILFYFSGRVVQDFLVANGQSYELYMVRRAVFTQYYPYLVQHLDPYIKSQIELKPALRNLIKDINNK